MAQDLVPSPFVCANVPTKSANVYLPISDLATIVMESFSSLLLSAFRALVCIVQNILRS